MKKADKELIGALIDAVDKILDGLEEGLGWKDWAKLRMEYETVIGKLMEAAYKETD